MPSKKASAPSATSSKGKANKKSITTNKERKKTSSIGKDDPVSPSAPRTDTKAKVKSRRHSKTKGQSKIESNDKTKSNTETKPPPHIPQEVMSPIAYHLGHISSASLLNLVLASKTMYELGISHLYNTLRINKKNAKQVFCGLDHSLNKTHEAEDRVHRSSPFGLDQLSIHNRKLNSLRHTRALVVQDWAAAEAIAGALGGRFRSADENSDSDDEGCLDVFINNDLDESAEKNHDHPVSSEWKTDRANLKHKPSDSLSNVSRISLELSFLRSSDFYPACACEWEPEAEPVVRVLSSCLSPKHVCADWLAAITFRCDEDGFETYLSFLMDNWPIESFTWHGVRNSALVPNLSFQADTLRIFFDDCGALAPDESQNYEPEQQEDFMTCQCHDRLRGAANIAAGRIDGLSMLISGGRGHWDKGRDKQVELVNLDCLDTVEWEGKSPKAVLDALDKKRAREHFGVGVIGTSNKKNLGLLDDEPPSEPKATQATQAASPKTRMHLSTKANAEVCICCGGK